MKTIQQITDDLKAQASTLGIEGVAVDSLCSLLAYSIYKNQLLQAKINVENSFSTSLSLNSRIHHACDLLYSVPRGQCPYIQVTDVLATETKSVKYLDLAFTYNGYYFYYKKDYDFSKSQPISSLEYFCSSKKKQTCEVTDLKSEFYYIDFPDENISEDIKILSYDTETGEGVISTFTNDSNLFYTKAEDGKTYKYQYLVLTLPGYGVRVMRHSDSPNWDGAIKMAVEYLPYSETLPDFSGFKSIPSVMFVYQPSTTGDPGQYEQKSKILTKPYSQRLEGIEEIYSRATTASHAKGTVATISDLLALLSSIDPQAYFRVYSDLKYQNSALTSDPLYTLAVVSNSIVDVARFADNVNSWKTAVDVSKNIQIVPALPSSPAITLYAKATSPINILTNETLANLTSSYKSMIGESLHHSKIEADIVRLGFDHVILYSDSKGTTEYVGTINNSGSLQRISYPAVQIYVL